MGMMISNLFRFRGLPLVVLVLMVTAARVCADVSVTAELSQTDITAGEMAELRVSVSGAQGAELPQELPVEGLQIRLTGQSTQVQMVNFRVSSSVLYTYAILPMRTGSFIIPSVPVAAGGRQFRTQSLRLQVHDRAASAPATPAPPYIPAPQVIPQPGVAQPQMRIPPRPQQPVTSGRLAFGEIDCPKKTLYAGEVVPVEIRFYFDARYPVQVRGKVDFGSEGILIERFQDPKESREEIDGAIYNVLTFKTLLSAIKPGTIDIPPAKLDSQIQLPGATPPGFDDPIFRQMMGGQSPFTQTKEIAVKTEPLHLQILPLPKEGRPASFAGAVGQFDIDSSVQNPRPAPGDPVTLSVKIGGKGNFKGMGAPVLMGTDGWRTYPPTDKFEASDALSLSGIKSFDYTLIAQEPRQSTPGAEFSYFDPSASKYVTIAAKPLPVDAAPGNAANAAASTSLTTAPTPGGSPSGDGDGKVNAEAKEGEPLSNLTLHSWKSPIHRTAFLAVTIVMIVITAGLAGFLYWRDLEARGGTASSRRRRRLAELRSILDAEGSDAAAFYDAAVEYSGLIASPSEKRDSVLASLTERRDLLKYGAGGSQPVGASERQELLQTLRTLELSK